MWLTQSKSYLKNSTRKSVNFRNMGLWRYPIFSNSKVLKLQLSFNKSKKIQLQISNFSMGEIMLMLRTHFKQEHRLSIQLFTFNLLLWVVRFKKEEFQLSNNFKNQTLVKHFTLINTILQQWTLIFFNSNNNSKMDLYLMEIFIITWLKTFQLINNN